MIVELKEERNELIKLKQTLANNKQEQLDNNIWKIKYY